MKSNRLLASEAQVKAITRMGLEFKGYQPAVRHWVEITGKYLRRPAWGFIQNEVYLGLPAVEMNVLQNAAYFEWAVLKVAESEWGYEGIWYNFNGMTSYEFSSYIFTDQGEISKAKWHKDEMRTDSFEADLEDDDDDYGP